MKNSVVRLVIIIFLTLCVADPSASQQRTTEREKKKDLISPLVPGRQHEDTDREVPESVQRRILHEIQSGIMRGEVDSFGRYLGPQVYISLKGGEGGYYSANQALYILQNFFSANRPVAFSFSSHGEIEGKPFATGRGTFNVRGVRDSFQIYVSLRAQEGRWVIAEFNAY